MFKRSGGHFIFTAFVFVAWLAGPPKAGACGVDWTEPQSHFEGADFQGHVMWVEKLGDLDTGKGLSLPIYAVFTSHNEKHSPYAGYGWTVPLLESRMVQINETGFRLDQPDGWFQMFWRDQGNPNILNGQGGWKAEIRGSTITAWATCGSKLIFHKGHLASMQLKGRTFDFVYEGSQVSEIREGVISILRVEKDAVTGEVSGLRLIGDQRIGLGQSARPRVKAIHNQNFIVGTDHSLGKITLADGKERIIEYAVDEKLNPTMKVGERLIVWNPNNKQIIKDGEWTYTVNPGPGALDSAAIERKNAKNQSEFWHENTAKGEEIEQGIDGVRKITSWFTSGKLAGKIRKVEEHQGNTVRVLRKLTYDEEGKLIREVGPDGIPETFSYDDQGKRISSRNPVPSPEELDHTENTWKAIIASSADATSKQNALFELALFYIGYRHNSSKGRDMARLIRDPQLRLTVILHSYDHDDTLKPAEKVVHYRELLKEYPKAHKRIERLIEIRSEDP